MYLTFSARHLPPLRIYRPWLLPCAHLLQVDLVFQILINFGRVVFFYRGSVRFKIVSTSEIRRALLAFTLPVQDDAPEGAGVIPACKIVGIHSDADHGRLNLKTPPDEHPVGQRLAAECCSGMGTRNEQPNRLAGFIGRIDDVLMKSPVCVFLYLILQLIQCHFSFLFSDCSRCEAGHLLRLTNTRCRQFLLNHVLAISGDFPRLRNDYKRQIFLGVQVDDCDIERAFFGGDCIIKQEFFDRLLRGVITFHDDVGRKLIRLIGHCTVGPVPAFFGLNGGSIRRNRKGIGFKSPKERPHRFIFRRAFAVVDVKYLTFAGYTDAAGKGRIIFFSNSNSHFLPHFSNWEISRTTLAAPLCHVPFSEYRGRLTRILLTVTRHRWKPLACSTFCSVSHPS
uniref:Uncharacterized protein n=1 Tax=Siphoviridae sp. ctgu013 TaxID=2826421 RepID=A0A8S5NH15_9CAUD|nr:MAG TPA: hypothetical protein [Siphoviridae sp. ctgu013]